MSKHTALPELRAALDEAITYGSHQEAMRLAEEGRDLSRRRTLPGELEYFLGQIELLNERFAHAIGHFDKAIAINPYDGGSFNDRALCLAELGMIDEALKVFDQGIEIEPDYATIYHNKGWLLNNIGRHQEAIACFEKALELEPGRAVTYDNLADAYFNLDKFRMALEAYEKVLALLKPGSCQEIKDEIERKIEQIKNEHPDH